MATAHQKSKYNTYMTQFESSIGEAGEVVREVAERYHARELQIRNSTNCVGLVDERLVIKAPKSTQRMGSLAVEAAALELLGRSGPLAAAIPEVVEFSTNPVFLVTTFLPGRIVEATTLHEISLKDREVLGHEIGAYVISQAQQVDLNAVRREVPPLAEEDNRLHGVFDFGRAGIGTASNEISPLVNLDSTIMQGVVDELRAASVGIDMDEVYAWDAMKKLTQLIHYINSGNYHDSPPMFVRRACGILSTHYPRWEWSEFDKLKVQRDSANWS